MAISQGKRSRIINTSRVLREIWINKDISRIQIAVNLHLRQIHDQQYSL